MTLSPWLTTILATAVLLAWVRLRKSLPVWRRATLLAMQPLCAMLLYLTLLPPAQRVQGRTLVVVTAGSAASQVRSKAGEHVVALPEAPPLPGIERVPDLASALRHHSDSHRLRIVGAGLTARDLDVASGLPLSFTPAPPPSGLIEVATPAAVAAGADFTITGHAQGVPRGRVELIDPAGRRVDSAGLAPDGHFSLSAGAREVGQALFMVRLINAQGRISDHLNVPVLALAAPPLRMLVLAGAPQPELKYLRRWAVDAGLTLHTQIAIGGGLQLGDSPIVLDAPTLDDFDIALLDERSVGMLSHRQRQALRAAVARGLGLLLRTSAPLGAAQREALREVGLPMQGNNAMSPVILESSSHTDAAASAARAGRRFDKVSPPNEPANMPTPILQRLGLSPAEDDFAVLAHDITDTPYAWWRAQGRGRIGVTTVSNSYLLVLTGRPDLHATLWSRSISLLARPHTFLKGWAIQLAKQPWKGQRVVLCGVGEQAHVLDPEGAKTPLLPVPSSGAGACAAYWPRSSGWHVLINYADRRPFYVRDPAQDKVLYTQSERVATRALINNAPLINVLPEPAPKQGPHWPWLLGLLASLSSLWWLERLKVPFSRS